MFDSTVYESLQVDQAAFRCKSSRRNDKAMSIPTPTKASRVARMTAFREIRRSDETGLCRPMTEAY
jgi:hypothetical protein